MTHSLRTDRGWTSMDMAGACSPQSSVSILIGSRTSMGDDGSTPIAAGIGNRIIPGAGRHFIMVAGSGTRAWDGAGVRMMSGGRPGCAGARLMIIAVGRLCRRERASLLLEASASRAGLARPILVLGWDGDAFASLPRMIFAIIMYGGMRCHAIISRASSIIRWFRTPRSGQTIGS